MWTIKRSHQHISTETLSEYFDGHLQGGALARVDGHVASCVVCRDELESLRDLVTMLRDLPVEATGRSFTIHAPPPKPAPARPSPLLRAPQWAYAGAASVAVIVLAVLVSADATGSLAPETVTTPLTAESPRQLQAQSEAAHVVTVERESAVAAPVAPVAPATNEATFEASPTTVTMAAEAEPITESAQPTGIEDEPSELQSAADIPGREFQTTPSEDQTRVSQSQDPEQSLDSQTASAETPAHPEETTATFWRVLEGLAGALGLVFLAGLALKWKNSRRTGRV